MTAVRISTLAGGDPRRYLAYDGAGTADVTDRFDRYLGSGNFRPEWMYVAERDEAIVARASFYGSPDGERRIALDHFDIRPDMSDPVDVGATLLTRMYGDVRDQRTLPDLHMFLPAQWRSTAEADAIAARITAAERAGLEVLVERHRFEWQRHGDSGLAFDVVPELSFSSAPVDDTVIELLLAISEGSFDAGTRRNVERLGVDGAARAYLHDMDELPGGREHWLIGHDAGGNNVGIVIGDMHTRPHPQVAFVGVDPKHRGHGYGRALLTEGTRRLADAGAEVVRADTDMTNTPMIAVFRQAGWHEWATRLVMQLPS